MKSPNDQWTNQLAKLIENTLEEFREQVKDQTEAFAIDCHPWNGVLDLALLTHAEVVNDPLLANPVEMAAWKHYHFGSSLSSWRAASELSSQMREAYYTSNNRAECVEEFLRACGAAAGTTSVQQSLSRYDLTDSFHISILHPDTDKDYYASK